jgi:hypothetical protein
VADDGEPVGRIATRRLMHNEATECRTKYIFAQLIVEHTFVQVPLEQVKTSKAWMARQAQRTVGRELAAGSRAIAGAAAAGENDWG